MHIISQIVVIEKHVIMAVVILAWATHFYVSKGTIKFRLMRSTSQFLVFYWVFCCNRYR